MPAWGFQSSAPLSLDAPPAELAPAAYTRRDAETVPSLEGGRRAGGVAAIAEGDGRNVSELLVGWLFLSAERTSAVIRTRYMSRRGGPRHAVWSGSGGPASTACTAAAPRRPGCFEARVDFAGGVVGELGRCRRHGRGAAAQSAVSRVLISLVDSKPPCQQGENRFEARVVRSSVPSCRLIHLLYQLYPLQRQAFAKSTCARASWPDQLTSLHVVPLIDIGKDQTPLPYPTSVFRCAGI